MSECWVCLRITPEACLKYAHKVWKDKETARKMGVEAAAIIQDTYEKDRFFFCSKNVKTVLAGLFYVLGVKHNVRTTQLDIANAIGVTQVSVRTHSVRWRNKLNITIKPQSKHEWKTLCQVPSRYGWGSESLKQCVDCGLYKKDDNYYKVLPKKYAARLKTNL